MSKSIIINKHGGPEVLELVDTTVKSPGPKHIRIKNLAIGLNFIDTYHRTGLYPIKLPCGLGMEGAGVVEEVGSEVKNFSKGDNVAYASPPLGSYSDERVIPERIAVKIPDGITHKIAASIMTKGLTVHYLLFKTYKASAGETILFHAAAGGVGQIFCQWAKSIGCKVIGTVGSDSKIDIAKKNGCDFVINYNKESFDKKVLEITENITGIEKVWTAENVAQELEQPLDREGDIAVSADKRTVIGGRQLDHDLSALKGQRLRTHGSLHEAQVPLVLSEPLNDAYARKAEQIPLRSHQIFDFAINGLN